MLAFASSVQTDRAAPYWSATAQGILDAVVPRQYADQVVMGGWRQDPSRHVPVDRGGASAAAFARAAPECADPNQYPRGHKSRYKCSLLSTKKAYTLGAMARSARPWGPGTSAIVRALVAATAPASQVELGSLIGVSQPRVSQVLSKLSEASAVQSTTDGYVGQRERLIDLYIADHRPALVEPDTPWYSLLPMREQVAQVCAHARGVSARAAVSADLAPDLLAAWRHPTLTIVYATDALDLTSVGFVRAEGRVDATLLVRHTSDPTLLAALEPWPRSVDGIPLVDPVQQVWDLRDLGGEDRTEAADRLRQAVLDRALAADA